MLYAIVVVVLVVLAVAVTNAFSAVIVNVVVTECFCRDLFVRRQCITTYLSSIVHIRSLVPSTASIGRSCDTLDRLIYVCCKATYDNRYL